MIVGRVQNPLCSNPYISFNPVPALPAASHWPPSLPRNGAVLVLASVIEELGEGSEAAVTREVFADPPNH